MPRILPLLVFTDLDGTLIDHDSYGFEAALPALAALRQIGAGVVLASSKTAGEISALRDTLDLTDWPAIVENGAGCLAAGSDETQADGAYARVRVALNNIAPELRTHFTGFGDMTTAQVIQHTGLSAQAAARAQQRDFSEPGLWTGTKQAKAAFLAELATHGVTAREGGRFLTLSFGATKADQMADIIAQYAPRLTLALGDAPNDVEMLETADHGVIVANPHRAPLPKLAGEDTGRITRTQLPGPQGWNMSVLELIAHLTHAKG